MVVSWPCRALLRQQAWAHQWHFCSVPLGLAVARITAQVTGGLLWLPRVQLCGVLQQLCQEVQSGLPGVWGKEKGHSVPEPLPDTIALPHSAPSHRPHSGEFIVSVPSHVRRSTRPCTSAGPSSLLPQPGRPRPAWPGDLGFRLPSLIF